MVVLTSVFGLAAGSPARAAEAPYVKLESLLEFQQAFNLDAGRPRLVLLMSPT
jgi:hypothetical protein